jgi:hypothetical protein
LTGREYEILKAIESGKITFWMLDGERGITITGSDTCAGSGQVWSITTTPGGGAG